MPQIVLRNVAKRYGSSDFAVKRMNLEIPDGSFAAIVGPSGCGKTTTLRMLAGLEQPTEGSITVGGRIFSSVTDATFTPPNRRDLGLVFQNYALWPHLNVSRNIEFGLSVQKVPRYRRRQRVYEVLESLHIGHLADRLPAQLSGGEQQRVAVARALAPNPSLVLFDEPLSNLDAPLRLELASELQRLHRELHMTALLVTHDQAEAMAVATMLVVMGAGTIEQIGSPVDVYHNPATVHVASFIGNPQMNLVAPIGALAHLADLAAQRHCIDRAALTTLGIRPEHVLLDSFADLWRDSAVVRTVIATGPSVIVRLSLFEELELTATCSGDADIVVGQTVEIGISPDRVNCFGSDGTRLDGSSLRSIDNGSLRESRR